MKFVVTWQPRTGGSAADFEAGAKRNLDVFSKWSPPEGLTFHQFLARLDTGGGYAVVETDDPMLLVDGPAKFAPWFEFEIHPVVDIMEAVPALNDAIEFRASIS